jgi:hypothetical protein
MYSVKSIEDCKCLQMHSLAVQESCLENYVNLNSQSTKAVPFTHKTGSNTGVVSNIGGVSVLCTDCVKHLGIFLDSKS